MRDYLLDIVEHTHALGCIDLIKITGDAASTQLEAISDDKSVVINATFKDVNKDFAGTFGLSNLQLLTSITSDISRAASTPVCRSRMIARGITITDDAPTP